MNRKKMILLMLAFFIELLPELSPAGEVDLPKTGQITCYDESGNVIDCTDTGQDGDIQAGVEWPEPRFEDNDDGTMTDHLTGLIWLKNANCGGIMTWQNGLTYCNNLANGSCGLTDGSIEGDWRLPNIVELESLLNAEKSNSAVWLNTQGFTNVQSPNYWSATTHTNDTNNAWNASISYGNVSNINKSLNDYVWPVRAGQTGPAQTWRTGQTTSHATGDDGDLQLGVIWPSPRFEDNGDGTITDHLAGLIWLKNANCFGARMWSQAVTASSNLASGLCGLSDGSVAGDWHLPNRKELLSLIDYSQYYPALPQDHLFDNVQSSYYWSGTTGTNVTEDSWCVNMGRGHVRNFIKSEIFYVWPVSAGKGGSFDYFVSTTGSDISGDGTEENPWQTIQFAIDSINGTESNPKMIHVSAGTYEENLIMDEWESIKGGYNSQWIRWNFNDNVEPDESFKTIIDGNYVKETIQAVNNVEIEGFSIINGEGSGINSDLVSPLIRLNILENNRSSAIYCRGNNAIIEYNIIRSSILNTFGYGQGVYCVGTNTKIIHNLIINNEGQGISCSWAGYHPEIINNTIANNGKNGIFVFYGAEPTIKNNIIINNEYGIAEEWRESSNPIPNIYYNDICTNRTGAYLDIETGPLANVTDMESNVPTSGYNLEQDPLFFDPTNNNFQLTSLSPCIDSGDPSSPSDPDGSRADMGAYYFSDKFDLSINTHWYNWATTFPEYRNHIKRFEFVRDGAWWSSLEPADYTSEVDWDNASWSYPYDINILNCNQSITYQSGYDELVKKVQSPDSPKLLILLDIHNNNLNADANSITYEQYYDYVFHVVERYDGDGINDMPGLVRPVIYFEIGNEVDSPVHNHNLTLESYVTKRLIPAYCAAKDANSNAVVLNSGLALGGDTGFDTTYLENMLDLLQANGGVQNDYFMDKLAVHYYYDPQDPEHFYQNFQQIKSAMTSHKQDSKPVWVTEFGIATKNDAGGKIREEDQASVLLRYSALMYVENIENTFIYNLKDVNSNDPSDWENVYGIYKVNCQDTSEIISAKLSVNALDAFYDKVNGLNVATINPETERNLGIYRVMFGNAERNVYVIWFTAYDNTGINPDHSSETTTIQVSFKGNTGILSDMSGNILDANLEDGSFVTIGEQPQYIEVIGSSLDADGDGIPDIWEESNGLNPHDPADAQYDPDGDGLTNLEEYANSTDPHNQDSDGDGMPDGWEVQYGLDPNRDDSSADSDSDGLTNLEEYQYRTDPTNEDTDGDGISDSDEVANGTNPRAITSSLTTETSALTMSVGATETILLQLANNNTVSDSFDLSVTGIDGNWYTLDQPQVVLSAGEVRTIPLVIHIPEECAVDPLEYTITVTAVSPTSGPVANGGADIPLQLHLAPIISDLYPEDDEALATNSVTVTWRTDAEAGTEVYYRVYGSPNFTQVSGEAGKVHEVLLENLTWDGAYEWYVISTGACESSQTDLRTFQVKDGVVFTGIEEFYEILRDYDQQRVINIFNRDVVSHYTLVEVMNPYGDLVAGFVGSGSSDETLSLDAGETTQITLAIHAQDAEKDRYFLTLKLTADAASGNPIIDYAQIAIQVVDPVFNLSFVEIAQNPAILTNTYRITNNGDTITDLRVFAEEAVAPQIVFQPKIYHLRLQQSESVVFRATFQPSDGVSQYTGTLTAQGAGQSVSITTHFGCPVGTSLYDVTLNDVHVCLEADAWYCTNKPIIDVDFDVPREIMPGNISRARLYAYFSLPWPLNTYRDHDVIVKLNDVVIDRLNGTIPVGPYGVEVPPALIQTGMSSVGRNRLVLQTVHMNRGHYVVATDFQLILDVDSITLGSVCASSQQEADLAAQDLPYLCDGEPAWQFCPRVDRVTPLGEGGTPKWNFSPGEMLQFSILTSNFSLEVQDCTLNLIIDDDFNSGGTPFDQNQNFKMVPGGSGSMTFEWTIPEGTEVRYYHLKATLTGSGDCVEEVTNTNAIAINQPVVGQVVDNETGLNLEGADVCAYGIGPNALYVDCTTTDENGMFTLYLPEGRHAFFAVKDGFSVDGVVVDTSGVSPMLWLSHDSSTYGEAPNSGHGQDPVTTSLGNFTLDAEDLSFKGRGLNFSFSRFYNSLDTYNGSLGYGWTHSYNTQLRMDGDVTIIKYGDGRDEFYAKQPDDSFEPQPGIHKLLVQEADGSFTLTDKRQRIHYFDVSGRLNSIVDKNGNTISLSYNNGHLATVSDPVGREVQFTYDTADRITQVEDPLGRIVTFTYDTAGDLISATDPLGNATFYTYDTNHQMLTAIDPKGNVFVSNTYDDQKRVITAQSDALRNVSRFEYDDRQPITTIIDPLGNETVHHHDNRNRLLKVVDALRNELVFEYDEDNNRTRVVDERGSESRFSYDGRGNMVQMTDALGNVTTFTYDVNNNLLSKTDALGNVTSFTYDANGNLLSITDALGNVTTISVNAYGQPLSSTNPLGNVTSYTYDAQGDLLTKTDALGNVTGYGYDAVGRLISVTDSLGRTTTYQYNGNDNLVLTTDPDPFAYTLAQSYDANGNRISSQDRRGNVTLFAYDQKDRMQFITHALGHTISYNYDALDRMISKIDQRGNVTSYIYDALGNLIETVDAMGNVYQKTYDEAGNLVRQVDPTGNTVKNTYDNLNRVATVEETLGNVTSYQYDALGRLVARTDANGRATQYEYDALGSLMRVIEPTGGVTQYEYDAVGNKIRFINALGNSFTYSYDALNRLIQDADGYSYQYDATGNLLRRIDAKGQVVDYTYDNLNRLERILYPDSGTVGFTYDPNGNLTSMNDSLGTTANVYDELNRVSQTVDPFGKVVGFSYDEVGNRTSVTYPDDNSVVYGYDDLNRMETVNDWESRVTSYSYDDAGKLIGMTYPNGTTAALSYDTAGRMTGLTNQKIGDETICSYDFTLDPVGNGTQVDKVEPLVPFVPNADITYQYDTDNRITSVTDGSFTFDSNGSVTNKTDGTENYTYDWNYENRLIQWGDGSHSVSYLYDGLLNRKASVKDGVTTRYVLDTAKALPSVLSETDASGIITARYIYGLGLIARVDDQGTHYYHHDQLGSTIALSNDAGETTDKYAYDAFGGLANRAGTSENPFTFVGQYGLTDEGNGLYYVRARYYDSKVGRFLSKDLLLGDEMDPKSLHRCVYVQNNPIRTVDVSGLCAEKRSDGDEILNLFLPDSLDWRTANSTPVVSNEGFSEFLGSLNPQWDVSLGAFNRRTIVERNGVTYLFKAKGFGATLGATLSTYVKLFEMGKIEPGRHIRLTSGGNVKLYDGIGIGFDWTWIDYNLDTKEIRWFPMEESNASIWVLRVSGTGLGIQNEVGFLANFLRYEEITIEENTGGFILRK